MGGLVARPCAIEPPKFNSPFNNRGWQLEAELGDNLVNSLI